MAKFLAGTTLDLKYKIDTFEIVHVFFSETLFNYFFIYVLTLNVTRYTSLNVIFLTKWLEMIKVC